MPKFDYGEGALSVVVGGFAVLVLLAIVLGLAGLDRHETFRVWAALSVIWAPALFLWFGSRAS